MFKTPIHTQDATFYPEGESFIQRQRRLQGEQNQAVADVNVTKTTPGATPQPQVPVTKTTQPAAQATPQQSSASSPAPAPAPTTGSPVTGNGKIPPPAPPAPPQPAYSSGPSQQLQPRQIPQEPVSRYAPQEFNVANPQLDELPAAYAGTSISQFAAPNQAALNEGQTELAQQILQNPETMSPAVVAQLKERNKEAELLAQEQVLQQLRQNAASRGVTNGGTFGGREADILTDSLGRIISGNRDIDLSAAATNRGDQLAALGAIESLLTGQLGRASTAFQNTLTGQTAQAADSRTASQDAISRAVLGHDADRAAADFDLRQQGLNAEERFRGYQSDRSAEDAAVQRVLAQFGIDESVANNQLAQRDADRSDAGFGLQQELGRGGLELDRSRLTEQGRQFNESNALNILQFLESQRQHNNNLGFNYNQLGVQGQNALVQMVMSLIGG